MLLPFHYNDLHRNSILAWTGLCSTDTDLLCRRKPEKHSCFCFCSVLLWDAWTGSQSGWRVCLQICYPVSQSTDSQMGIIINDSSYQETNSSSPEHGYSCCAAPKGWLFPLLFKNDFQSSNLRLFGSSVLFTHQPWCTPLRLPVPGCCWGNLQPFHGTV